MSNFLMDEDTNLLAAEFVLGTLASEERASAQSLLGTDHGFIAMVRIWERRFGELHLMVEPVEPDAKILQRIKAEIAKIAPAEPAPEGKPAAETTSGPVSPAAAGPSADAQMTKPTDLATGGATPQPDGMAPNGTIPNPLDVPVTTVLAAGETEKPAETPPAVESVTPAAAEVPAAPEVPTAVQTQPSPDVRPPETLAKPERAPDATSTPPPLPPPAPKLPDKLQDQPPERRPEITIDVIRSRGRWRAFGVCMAVLLMGLVGLLAAWRLVPERLPAGLRPAALMTSVGIELTPKPAPPVKRAPAEAQFDE
jgi:hypothetical protein